ncbi:bifunctional phosphoribosyl-AMP cyclohydrolase/phosphoribosyl-ATP diphosphatase HisIE [Geomicrobium sp. JCM 19055]|uniref:bifunctional phosphoribosyl-AMP cyclohydrolase/phosphoribosyl-ATP diphosphatase HisIE n=1 Tax=Geomicrobium sp. JCM 19055 TaxID=1460649 RepID=UPI00045ECFA0|nr:bifunctional phosphoribosyl-AMP cyclohydrolase/phosphoribosyl-ATP diphosphatase HisIE [Geomicrobium sp. JCM 19055]GAJ97576.1 phosphoribosyl-AMP cyclohydrolase [Geomicrobium sp. JCM 19055]
MKIDSLRFNDDGLIPAVVQDARSKEVLTLAYMNKESLQKTIETKETWFYSRSREELWHKGATSGNTQTVTDVKYDCDADSLVVLVEPHGPACHTGSYSCFTSSLIKGDVAQANDSFSIIRDLEKTIAARKHERPEGAYTTYLFNEGIDKILKKIGEEASEIIIAAKNRDLEEMRWESADFLFHWLVLLEEQGISVDDVLETLRERHQ